MQKARLCDIITEKEPAGKRNFKGGGAQFEGFCAGTLNLKGEKWMKRTAMIFLAILLMLSVASAHAEMDSEAKPDGTVYDAYQAVMDEGVMEGWRSVSYIEPSGLLLTAYTEMAEITVDLVERREDTSYRGILEEQLNGVTRYGRVTASFGPDDWSDSPWGGGTGAHIRYRYLFLKGSNSDDEYTTDVYIAQLNDRYDCKVTLNSWGADVEGTVRDFEDRMLPTLKLVKRRISTQFMAYLKDAYERDGQTYVVLDFCSVEYDPSIFTIYTANDVPEDCEYAVSADALVWMPNPDRSVYEAEQVSPDAQTMKALIDRYYQKNDIEGIYNVLFDEKNEILWMQHYNVY